MAEKRFAGAPFGTQTARFDVTGVHPKSKLPGSFTQIPYDKYSMLEQKRRSLLSNLDAGRFARVDCCLQNICFALNSAKEDMKKVESLKRPNIKKENVILKDAVHSFTNSAQNHKKIEHLFKDSKDFEPLEMKKMKSYKNTDRLSTHQKDTMQKGIDKKSEAYRKQCFQKNISHGVDVHLVSLNISCNSKNAESSQKAQNENVVKDFEQGFEGNEILPSEPLKISLSGKRVSFSENNNESSELSNFVTGQHETQKTVIESAVNNETLQISNGSNADASAKNNVTKQASFEVGIETKTSIISSDEIQKELAIIPSALFSMGRSDESVEEPIDNSMLPKIMIRDFQVESVECIVPQNSASLFPSQYSIILQERKKDVSCDEYLKRKLGPGTYNTVVGGFSPSRVEQRASGPGWSRQLEVERLASLPHLLYKEQWEENKMLKRKLGPGSYEIKDFIQSSDLKPRSSKGICENLATRFDKGVASFTPGPGTYGIGGVPQRAIEEKDQQSTSTKGMLDSGDRKRNLPSVGSHLGPGTYRHKTCTEEMLHKVTSLRGPYELYSGDRNKPISEGYQAAPKLADLGPGQYEIGSFVDDLHSIHRKSHGAFGKMAQYPEVPTERLFLFSHAHYPKRKDFPGPGAYSIQEVSKPEAVNSPGFLSSAKRDDKLSQKFFTRNFNPVGAGRYDIQKFDDAQDLNGHTSVFKSKTGKPNLQMAKFLQERIRSKDVPVENRMFITAPEKPSLCRAVTVL